MTFYSILLPLFGLLFSVLLITGCGEDIGQVGPQDKLKIVKIEGLEELDPGSTTTLKAAVEYSGDERFLRYKWSASNGQISSQGQTAVYIAPPNPGTDTVTLTVTDGILTEKKSTSIVIRPTVSHELLIGAKIHWPAVAENDVLKFNVKVEQIFSPKIKLRYEIQKDKDRFNAFLSLEVNKKIVLADKGVGDDLPGGRSLGEVDVSNIVKAPGGYLFAFYIKPGNRIKDGWILNSAKLIGVEGTSDLQ